MTFRSKSIASHPRGVRRWIAATMLCGALSPAGATDAAPYVLDRAGQPMRSGQNLCWRTGYWSPAAAQTMRIDALPAACSCEPDLLPAASCSQPQEAVTAAPVAAPRPAAMPASPPPVSAVAGPVKVKLSAEAGFRFNTSVLDDPSRQRLDALVAELSSIELEVVLAVGHADRIGPDTYNQDISEKRAAEVKAYLIGKGIPANRIYTEGKGEKQPAHLGDCDDLGAESSGNQRLVDCLEADRRVEIEAIGIR